MRVQARRALLIDSAIGLALAAAAGWRRSMSGKGLTSAGRMASRTTSAHGDQRRSLPWVLPAVIVLALESPPGGFGLVQPSSRQSSGWASISRPGQCSPRSSWDLPSPCMRWRVAHPSLRMRDLPAPRDR